MHKGYISMDYILNGLEYNAMLREEEGVAGQQGRRGAATVGRNARRRGYLCGSLYKYLADCLLCGGCGCHCEQHARTYAFRRRAARTVLAHHSTLLVRIYFKRLRFIFMLSSKSRIASRADGS